ncbi:MAG: hypothetical protein J6U96_03725 [Elusimicrobiaceae bacterium]|nr:hypothetical protein [Elusimicrobiaceae bacterium]
MKKLVITAVVVGFAAVAAQAQDFGAVRVTSEVWGRAANISAQANKKAVATVDSLSAAAAKKAEQEKVRRAREEQAQAQKAAKQNKHFSHVPATGAMRDYAVEGRLQESAAKVDATSGSDGRQVKKEKPAAKKAKKSNWVLRAMGIAKGENETEAEYTARVEAMAFCNK